MARGNTVKFLRTTRANLNTQAAANNLIVGEPYFITDEGNFAIGTAVNAYQVFMRPGVFGECKLILDGANLRLIPWNGNRLSLTPSSPVVMTIPDVGITLAATGLTASTLYYIYAYNNSGTLALEASTTGHVWYFGQKVKSGDSSRTLVGMAYVYSGPQFGNSYTARSVRSWYNRDKPVFTRAFTQTRSVTSTSWVEINSEIRCDFCTWDDESVTINSHGWVYNSSGSEGTSTAIGVDFGLGSARRGWSTTFYGTLGGAPAASFDVDALPEGRHFATLLGFSSGGSTGSWIGGSGARDNSAMSGVVN